MEKLDIKVEPETHNDDTPHVHNMQQDTFLTCNKKLKYESMLHHEVFLKDDPDTEDNCSELIDDTQVMCTSTSQSSDGVAMHIKEEPAADVGYDEPAPLLVSQLMDATCLHLIGPCAGYVRLAHIMWPANPAAPQECLHCCNPVYRQTASGDRLIPVPLKDEVEDGVTRLKISISRLHLIGPCAGYVRLANIMWPANPAAQQECLHCCNPVYRQTESDLSLRPVPLKDEMEDSVTHLKISSIRSVRDQQVVPPSGLSTDNVCVSGNSDCTRQVNVKEHAKCTASGNTYQCDVCHKFFSKKSILQIHIRTHTGEKPYKCVTCSKSFKTSSNLYRHNRIHTKEKPYKCNICDKSFGRSGTLDSHILIHTGEKPFRCDICNMTFSRESNLKAHSRTHTGEKPYKCNMCGKSFSYLSNLYCHIRRHTREKPHKCDICNKSFGEIGALKTHTRIHSGVKPYKCNICDKSFSRSSYLHCHTRFHTGEKPYKCSMCDKTFTLSTGLHRHTRIHTGEKPHKCDICNKRFGDRSSLGKHTRIHTGVKPYKCSMCDKSFTESSALHKHTRIHTGEKPHKCNMCNKTFTQSTSLHKHTRIHSGEKPY